MQKQSSSLVSAVNDDGVEESAVNDGIVSAASIAAVEAIVPASSSDTIIGDGIVSASASRISSMMMDEKFTAHLKSGE
jgi:hypothetical protein